MMTTPLRKSCAVAFAFPIPLFFSFPIFKNLKRSIASPLLLAALLVLASFSQTSAQTQFWSDTFEDTGAPSAGTRTPSLDQIGVGAVVPYAYYFMRTNGSNLDLQSPFTVGDPTTYLGMQGTKFWAGEDTDKVRTGSNVAGDKVQNITWTGINISGKSGLTFKGLFAALPSQGWLNILASATYDFLEVEYQIDGGTWTKAGAFYGDADGRLKEDTNNDMIGDGIELVRTFREFTWTITGTGASLSLRFRVSADGGATQEFAIDNFRLFEAAAVTPTITANPANATICAGSNTTFNVTASNATSYKWQVNTGSGFTDITEGAPYSGTTTPTLTITGATAGMSGYQYRARAINGSNSVNSTAATLTISSITVAISRFNVTTPGGNNGTATAFPNGGVGPYTYSWAPSGGSAATASNLTAGDYTVTVTDNLGCSTNTTVTVNQPADYTISTTSTNVSCNGAANGSASVSVNASSGTPPYTYSWAPSGGTGATATGLAPGTYTVTIKDATNYQTTRNFTITQPTVLNATASAQTDVSCNGAATGSATVSVTGGTPGSGYTYSWSPSGGTAATASGLTAGTYTVTVTDANGCTDTQSFTITEPTALSVTTSQTNVLCNSAATGSAGVTVTGGSGTYTYTWAPSGGTGATATGLTAGTYTVTIKDAVSLCETTRTFTINQPTALSVTTSQTNILCNGGATGSAGVTVTGGSGAYTYLWSPSGGTAATATGLAAGTYTVIIKDANLCQTTRTFTINQPSVVGAIASSTTNVTCNGGSNGSATVTAVGGVGSYTYSWAPSGGTAATATGLTAGTYTVTIKDANNCTATQNFTITEPTALSVTTSQTDVLCNGGATGSAGVTVTGGSGTYTYSWAPSGGTAATATGLTAGTYTVTIKDAVSLCQTTRTFTINQPTAFSVSTSQTNILCNGGATGSAGVTVTGGSGAYTYLWSPSGGTAATATGLTAGTYTVTITDANLCQTTRTFTINQPNAITITSSKTDVSCNGGSNGSAGVTVSGGTGSYTYSWAPSGGTAATATGLAAGTYTVTITDANNCQATQNITINQPAAFAVTTSQTDVSCNGGANGTATVTVSGGTPSYTYSWAPTGGTAATATGLVAGTYTVTITDANLCQTTQSITVNQPAVLSATPSQTDVLCNGSATGTASVSVSGGTGAYTYLWSPSGGTAATATGLTAGVYTVTIKDANLCQTTHTFTITQPAALNATFAAQTNVACNGGITGSATVSVTGGAGSYTYSWAPSGGTAATASGLAAGTYTVTVTDANGCTDTQSFTITEPSALTATAGTQNNVSCNGGANGSAKVNVSGGSPNYTYSWAPSGGTAATASGLTAGTYTVTIKDANNCTTTQSFTITEPAALNVTASSTPPSTFGGTNGTATVNITGGTGAYTYSWSPSGGTAATATGLTAGTYTVTIKDANLCQTTKTVTIVNPTTVTAVSSTNTNGNYGAGAIIPITITFTEPVTVTGTPTLALNTGGTASYTGGTGTSTLTFSYTVGAVQIADLDYSSTSALSLAGGATIKNGSSFNADLTLASPGSAGSLGANKNIAVDGIRPTVTSIIRLNSSPTNLQTLHYNVTFSEAVTGVDVNDFTLATSGLTADVATISGSGNTYILTISPVIGTGTLRLDLNASGTGIQDAFSNAISGGFTSGETYDVDQTPAISTTGTLSAVNTIYGTASANTSFSVSAVNLTTAVTITAPTGFELSSNSGSGFANAITVGSTGALASTTIYVRLKANAKPVSSPYSGNISLSTTGGTTVTVATVSSTATPKPLTLALNASPTIIKVYNGSSTAVLVPANYTLSGILIGDVVTVSGAASYADANIGIGKIITANTFVLAGADAANYDLTTNSATTTGNIAQKSITLALNASPLITKVYNQTNAAPLVAANYNLSGIVGSDQVSVSGTATYADANIGVAKTITVGNLALNGPDAANYNLTTSSATTTGNITQKSLTLALNATPLITKTYDGLNTATLAPANYTLSGVLGSDVVTVSGAATYADVNIGIAKAITVGTFVLAGTDAANYDLTTATASTTGNITPKSLTLSLNASPLITKAYDGTSTAVLAPANYNLTGVVSGDVVTVSGTANYDNRLKGNGKTITATAFVLAGTAAPNYNLTTLTASTTGNIISKTIALVFNNSPAITKVYDGTTAITLSPNNYSLSGVSPGDDVTVNFTANYVSKNAAPQVSILASTASLSGTNADNYTLNLNLAGATGAITPKPMSIIADAKSKAIGTADPVFTYTTNGLIGTDALTGELTRAPGETAGNYAITQGTLSAGNNYTSAFTPATLTIGGQLVTVTAAAKTKAYGDADPVLTYTVTGLAAGDALTGSLSRSPGENVGSYGINVGTLTGGSKYSINFVGAALTINKAVLTVTAANKQICLGASLPAFDVSYVGFKNADNANSLSTKPVVTTTATATSPAGNYTLIPSGAAADNYSFVYVNGQLSINNLLVAAISSSAGTTLAKGQVAVLSASGGTTYTWANADGIISGQNTATLTVSPTVTTTYTVTASNGGCSTTASITLTVNEAAELVIEATNIMTPNGDGINDKWIIKDIELYPNNTVTVFDRGGRIVFSQKGYKNSWDATLRGTPLAEGTYYFAIDLGDGKTIKKGFITIIHK